MLSPPPSPLPPPPPSTLAPTSAPTPHPSPLTRYKLTPDAASDIGAVIAKGTDQSLRSKYNGRLTDNLLQWASDEMNQRLPLDATGDQLITLSKQDLEHAIVRFTSARPPVKKDPTLWGGERVEQQLKL